MDNAFTISKPVKRKIQYYAMGFTKKILNIHYTIVYNAMQKIVFSTSMRNWLSIEVSRTQ